MYSELIAIVMIGKEEVDEVRSFLDTDRDERLFRQIDIALIEQDASGKISCQQLWQERDHPLNKRCHLATTFAETIFDISRQEDRRQLADAGLDPFFMRKVSQTLTPESRVYLLHIPNEHLIDSRNILEILGEQHGTLYHTIFRPQVEEVLLQEI